MNDETFASDQLPAHELAVRHHEHATHTIELN